MKFRNVLRILFPALVFVSTLGCGKPENQTSTAQTIDDFSPDTVARIHWLGRRWIDLDIGGFSVSRVWSLPETKRLQAQTFDKLSTNAWHLLLPGGAGRPIPAAVLRPLFDDLAMEESYFELRLLTNSSSFESCFAIHLPSRRAGTWTTNLAIAAELFTGGTASSDAKLHGWTLQRTNAGPLILLSRVGDWTLVSVGPKDNPLFNEITARISRLGVPVPAAPTNYWLEADVDCARTVRALSLSWKMPASLARVQFGVTGDGAHVLSDGVLTFSSPLPAQLESWRVPTNLIHGPLLSFTSVRGIGSLLEKWKTWDDLQIGAPPNQLFFWSLSDSPYQTYVAAPSSNADHKVSAVTDLLLQKGNPWLATNGYINFNRAHDSNGVVWGNMDSIRPFIKSAAAGVDGWLYAGLLPDPGSATNAPLSNQIVQNLIQQTNLVYYNWELTGQLLSPRLVLGQTARQVARRSQMPTDCASLNWLGVLIPRLDLSETRINQTSSNQLTFYRKSTVGFTALELHLLADWLESPQFPNGLHSLP